MPDSAKPPQHLWTGDWEAWSQDAVLADLRRREALERSREEEPPGEPPRGPGRTPRYLIAALVAAALAGGAFAIGTITAGDDAGAPPAESLPADTQSQLKPRKGQTRAGAVYEKASPAVASVRAGSGSGTAFLVDSEGTLVTNAHVVGESERVAVRFGPDGRTIQAEVRGTDPSTDLAVVTVPPSRVPNGVTPLRLGDSDAVEVGDLAIAIGNPFGLERTATEGIVSAIGRDIEAPNGFSIDKVIQTDAPINPGNSGGPLLDQNARVVGVTSQIATSGSPGNVGIGFAVPSNTVRSVVPQLKQGRNVRRAYLGVESTTAVGGPEIANVIEDGPADRAGIEPGDVVKSIGGEEVTDPAELSATVQEHRPGDRVEIVIERDGAERTVTARLGTRPAQVP